MPARYAATAWAACRSRFALAMSYRMVVRLSAWRMAHGVLHVPKRDPGDQAGGAERPAQPVRADLSGNAGLSGQALQPVGGPGPPEPAALAVEQQRPAPPALGGVVHSAKHGNGQRDDRRLAALTEHTEQLIARLRAQVGHIQSAHLTNAEPDHSSRATRACDCGPSRRAVVNRAAYSSGCSTVRRCASQATLGRVTAVVGSVLIRPSMTAKR